LASPRRAGEGISGALRAPRHGKEAKQAPHQAHFPIPSLGTLLLDPATTVMEASGTLDARGRASFEVAIPPLPGLIGTTRYWQAIVDGAPHYTNRETTTLTSL